MRRADGVSSQIRRRIAKGFAEEIRGFAGDGKEIGAAGDVVMNAGGGHEMAHVIHLEVERVLKGTRDVRAALAINPRLDGMDAIFPLTPALSLGERENGRLL